MVYLCLCNAISEQAIQQIQLDQTVNAESLQDILEHAQYMPHPYRPEELIILAQVSGQLGFHYNCCSCWDAILDAIAKTEQEKDTLFVENVSDYNPTK